MGDFTQMHIFFIVTTIGVVFASALLCIALYLVVRILRTIDKFSQSALDEATLLRADIADLRSNVRAEGAKLKFFTKFGKKFMNRFEKDKEDLTK